MGLSALSLLTHGWHHPGEVGLEVAEHPMVQSVVEVRPTIRATVPPSTVGPAGVPVVVGASELSPQIQDTEGPQQGTDQEEPLITSAEELVPVIRDTEEK